MTSKLSRGLMISTLCLASAFGAWATAQTGGKAPPPPSAVAVVDLAKLSTNLDEAKGMRERLQQLGTSYETRLKSLADDLTNLEKELSMTAEDKRGTPEFLDKLFRARELETTLKARREGLQRQIEFSKGDDLRAMFNKITDAVGRVGKDQGFDIILWDDRSISPPKKASMEVEIWNTIKERRILFASDRVDITDQVLTLMNNEFKAGKK